MTIKSIFVGDEERPLPLRWEICGCCDGEGKSSAYLGAITQEDRLPGGAWDDPDDFQDYLDGAYDRPCDECRGTGKVQVADIRNLSPEEFAAYREAVREEAEDRAVEAAERRMGA